MGLDMYLEGEKYLLTNFREPDKNPTMDGFRLTGYRLELAYWRKHPDLHGFIIQTFASGLDECQRIDLSVDDLREIMKAVVNRSLPHTEGFFFGESDGTERDSDIVALAAAIEWLLKEEPDVIKSVIYQASW